MNIDARLAEIHALPWDQIPAGLEALVRELAAPVDPDAWKTPLVLEDGTGGTRLYCDKHGEANIEHFNEEMSWGWGHTPTNADRAAVWLESYAQAHPPQWEEGTTP